MRHLHTIQYVTDPATGRRYAIPAGGSTDGGTPPANPDDGAQGDDDGGAEGGDGGGGDPDDEPLGEAGRKALQAERKARKEAERKAREAAEEAERLKREAMSEQERALAEAREEAAKAARAEAESKYQKALLEQSIKAAAAGKMADPTDALAYLDTSDLIGEDGMVDEQAVADAVSDLLKAKPYLAGGAMPPGADQGVRKPADKQKDLEDMTPEEVLAWHAKRKGA